MFGWPTETRKIVRFSQGIHQRKVGFYLRDGVLSVEADGFFPTINTHFVWVAETRVS